ncbi:glycosyltransferase family 4 protein [Hyunsoonleella sp. SJ7]|uniref:Glycosyltransferase family 4 protein n=1 Tax=Hyunsoonleella aquatilis TaxID=2762758 RepID=A0A923KI22_9FLAO|nr:glycosyltransferase [Hyunsoonleella aquatilis]MBC3757764.1 glycosyltransferase family 4 protein [Hyunsoonleella aquatilis]
MKILMVSMNSIHFERWTNQLRDAGHEVHWFNIRDGSYSENLSWVKQIIGWKYKYPKLKGRVFIKRRLPKLYKKLGFIFENSTEKAFESAVLKIRPDVVHSFALYVSCSPILKVMNKYPEIKWIYSAWGSDLFYFQHKSSYLRDIKNVLPRVNYLFADCKRDVALAQNFGFKGRVLGVYPGGGGYPNERYEPYVLPPSQRNLILIKGYQGRSGRAIPVLKAIAKLNSELKPYQLAIFGVDEEVENFIEREDGLRSLDLRIYKKSEFLNHFELMKLMGQALIYIGNSNSDGMPNTLLEAIIMGAFPIQSNPGGATAEVINHGRNGLLIQDCEDDNQISKLIKIAVSDKKLVETAFKANQQMKDVFERSKIANAVISKYNSIRQ